MGRLRQMVEALLDEKDQEIGNLQAEVQALRAELDQRQPWGEQAPQREQTPEERAQQALDPLAVISQHSQQIKTLFDAWDTYRNHLRFLGELTGRIQALEEQLAGAEPQSGAYALRGGCIGR